MRLGPTFDAVFLTLLASCMALVILHMIPGLRRWLECSAMALVLMSPFPVQMDLYFSLCILGTATTYHLLHGSWSRRSTLRFGLASERTAKAALPIATTWQRAIPGTGHPDDYWTGTLVDFEADPHDPLTIYLRYRNTYGLFSEATLTFIEREPPTWCRFIVEPEFQKGEEERILSFRFSEIEEFETLIESRVDISCLTLSQAATLWLDDNLGDELDTLSETTQRRQRWVAEWPGLKQRLSRRKAVAAERMSGHQTVTDEEGWVGAELHDGASVPQVTLQEAEQVDTAASAEAEDDFDILAVMEGRRDLA